MKTLSIVVPCYNEEKALPLFYAAFKDVVEKTQNPYELVLVDDGSKDNTANTIKQLASEDANVKYMILSRNFGKESAMYAGLKIAKADYIGIMDADLQDPPDFLPKMLTILQTEDYDCVGSRRVTRKGEPKIRSFFARRFYKLINSMSDTEIVDGARDFRLMKKKMVDSILSMQEVNRFSKGIFSWVGYKTFWLEYENRERVAGETKWSFSKLFKYSLDGIISFSTAPLKAISVLGFLIFLISLIVAIVLLIRKLVIPGSATDGWTSLIIVIIMFSGIQLFCLGILGQYLAKTYSETKKRPIYIATESNVDTDLVD